MGMDSKWSIIPTYLIVADCCGLVRGCSRGMCWGCLLYLCCGFRNHRLPITHIPLCKDCEINHQAKSRSKESLQVKLPKTDYPRKRGQ